MDFKSYPNYKDSGVEWLGKVPEHWGIVRTKEIFHHRKEDALLNDEIVTAFRDGQVTLRKNRRTDGFTNSFKEHGYQHIECGDLVIHEMDAFAGAIGVSDSSGKSTPVYTVCYAKNNSVNHYFYSFLFREMSRIGFISSLAKGIRVRSTEFRWGESRNVYLAYPPISEQNQIVSFLDSETSRIDNLIAKQEKLIEKLEEHRKSVISHAVTKGLDPNAKMKDSGGEWLGEVPEHWQLTKIKFLSTFVKGKNPEQLYDEKGKGMYSYLSMDYLRGKSSGLFAPLTNNLTLVDDEQTLIIWDGSNAGEFVKAKQGILSSTMGAAFTKKVNKQFFWYLCLSIEPEIRKRTNGMGIPHVSGDFLKNFLVAMPNLGEQSKLAAYLDHETSKIDNLIAKQEKLIEKLKEYRTSIISHAVTGKIDVRDLVA